MSTGRRREVERIFHEALGKVLEDLASAIAIQIPASLPDGDYTIVASVAGAQSPGSVMLSVQH